MEGVVQSIAEPIQQRTYNVTVRTVARTVRTAAGTARTVAGTVRTAAGTVRTAAGTVRTAAGTVRTAAGTVRTVAGTVRTAAGTVRTVAGTVRTARTAAGTVTEHTSRQSVNASSLHLFQAQEEVSLLRPLRSQPATGAFLSLLSQLFLVALREYRRRVSSYRPRTS